MKVNDRIINYNSDTIQQNYLNRVFGNQHISSGNDKVTFNVTTVSSPYTNKINQNSYKTSLYNPRQIIRAYANKSTIDKLVKENPKILELLKSKDAEYKVNPENVTSIINTHLLTTTAYALEIANEMGLSTLDKKILEQAATFHDFGKILIPKEIIDKPGKLTEKERDIINLHAELGAELLSQLNISPRVTGIIRNHHNSGQSNDLLCEILSVADIYSALREERSYKKPLSEEESLNILDQNAENGKVSTEVVNALKSAIIKQKAA